MRRSAAILLLTILALFAGAPIVAAAAHSDPEANLPACCRRDGKHHCTMHIEPDGSSHQASVVTERCPGFPRTASLVQPHTPLLTAQSLQRAELLSHPSHLSQIEAGYRIAHFRNRQKRGPPAILA